MGWYENSDLSGEAVASPYYCKSDVMLYAKWEKETGESFEKAITLSSGVYKSAFILKEGQIVYFKFVPTETKTYTIHSPHENYDSYGVLYDENYNWLTSDEDSGGKNNFSISHELMAGETYYIATSLGSGTGTFTVGVVE